MRRGQSLGDSSNVAPRIKINDPPPLLLRRSGANFSLAVGACFVRASLR